VSPQENFQIKGIQVLLEKLIRSQLEKKFPAFYGNPRFFTALTSAFLKY
jgi:hypothetical protein